MIEPMEVVEKRAIVAALWETKGHIDAAALPLNLGVATVYRKIGAYGIDIAAIRKLSRECRCGEKPDPKEPLRVIARCRSCASATGLPYYSVK
jgi:hypothetical protein